jgi:hypothetical protein
MGRIRRSVNGKARVDAPFARSYSKTLSIISASLKTPHIQVTMSHWMPGSFPSTGFPRCRTGAEIKLYSWFGDLLDLRATIE